MTTDTETLMIETDFIIGSCSRNIDSSPMTQLDKRATPLPVATTVCDDVAYTECIRMLTRRLRMTPKLHGNLRSNSYDNNADVTDATNSDDDWNEQYVNESQGIPELLALQNSIMQLQHAFHLLQQEANTAIHDTSVAQQSSQHWQREYHAAKQSAISLEQENRILKQQNESLITDKRKLKAACKKLLNQQHAVQSQQVESYVVSALVSHEQFLHGTTNTWTGKNRSRTTTLDTTGTTAGDDFTTLDEPFTNSPNTTIESFDGCRSPKASAEVVDRGNVTEAEAKSTTPPTIVTTNEQDRQSQHKGINGFGHAFGRTFKFIDNHVNKKDQHHRAVAENPVESKCNTTNDNCVTSVEATVDSTYSPLMNDRPYAPIRFDIITPTRSEDSNDSVKAHRRKMQYSQSPSANKALIDLTALYDGPIDNSNDHIERSFQNPTSDQILLSLPILPHSFVDNGTGIAGSLKSVSPISIPEVEEEESLHSHEHPSALRIQCQRYSCDPSLLRSLSIPTMPIQAQQSHSTTPDLQVRHC